MVDAGPSAQAPNSPSTGGRGALAEAVGSVWSALVLGLLAAIFAWFWFGDSGESEDPGQAAVAGAAEPLTEPVESAVGVGGQQQAQRTEAAADTAEEAAAVVNLLKTEEISVCTAKANHENQTDMGQREKWDLSSDNQKDLGNVDTMSETSVVYPLDSELEVVFPQAIGASDGHEPVLGSVRVEAIQCDAQEALLDASPTAEGAQSSAQMTVRGGQVLQSGRDIMDTFTITEASESQGLILDVTEAQYTMREAVADAFTVTDADKSVVHKDVSEFCPTAISAAPLLLHEAVMDAYTRAEGDQSIVQKDELAVKAEQSSGLEHELAAKAAHADLYVNGLAAGAPQPNVHEYVLPTKATHAVLQREWLDAEAGNTNVQEDGLATKAAPVIVHKDWLDADSSHTTVQGGLEMEVTNTTVQKDGLDAEAVDADLLDDGLNIEVRTTVEDDELAGETPHPVVHKDRLDAEATHLTVQEDGLDAEPAHTTVQEDGLDAEAAHDVLHKDGLDAEERHSIVEESGLNAEATQAGTVQQAFLDFSPAAIDIQNICAKSKEPELLVYTIGQKLGYINGHEVINHLAGCHETSAHKSIPTDSYATKELDTLQDSPHFSDENCDQIYKYEPQPRNIDSDSKMRKIAAVTPMPQYVIVKFRVHYITQSESQLIAVTGNHESLGEWNIYVPLKPDKDGFWSDSVLLPVDSNVEWKFVMVENGKIKRWEECNNRYLKTGHDDTEAHQSWGYH